MHPIAHVHNGSTVSDPLRILDQQVYAVDTNGVHPDSPWRFSVECASEREWFANDA